MSMVDEFEGDGLLEFDEEPLRFDAEEGEGADTESLASTTRQRKGAAAKRGNYGSKKNGMKFCSACGKWKKLAEFPQGSNKCYDDKKAVQNLAVAAKAQNEELWWAQVMADDKMLQRVVKNYHLQCAPIDGKKGKKRATFHIAKWVEEIRQEQQVLTDGVYELMDLRTYIHYMAKPKNGALEAVQSTSKWEAAFLLPEAISDSLGPCDMYRRRVGIKVKDLVTIRHAEISSRGLQTQDKEKKCY